jgi:hypothetical protein
MGMPKASGKFPIEDGAPLPHRGRAAKYPLADLEVGQCFLISVGSREEAWKIRSRLASLLDSLRAAAGAPRGALPSATLLRDSIKVRDDSIARLQKELEQTTAELERIRKRLAPRRP